MLGHGAGVAACDRAGERRVAGPQDVVERGASSGPTSRAGSATPAADSSSSVCATSVTRWFEPCASAAWYSGRDSSGTQTGSPPISSTSASATGRSVAGRSGVVTPKGQPDSLPRSSDVPVKVITGCSASGSAPARAAGSSTATP